MSLGIKPGISKKIIDVKDIERKLENLNPDILWLRIRIEGSTLKVNIEEKVNPPSQLEGQYGNLVATKEGEIQRIYTFGGRAAVKVGQFVKEGDIVKIGNTVELEVIHTPGHSPGGICLKTDNIIFVGDTLFQMSIGRTDFPGGSYKQLINNIKEKLLCFPDDTVCYPGHGPATTIGFERQNNPFL
jgi:glyoxylase-like metal-dependent hydrolase (beta-lactamase superfamily II)